MSSSSRSSSVIAANKNDYLDELGLLNDGEVGLPANDDVAVNDDVEDMDPSSFAIPTLPHLPTNDDDEHELLLQQQQQQQQQHGANDSASAPTHTAAQAMTTTATAAPSSSSPPPPRKHSSAVVVLQSYKSALQFRTDLSKSDRASHPCGILHFTRAGARRSAPEEHVFAWISQYHNPTHLDNTLLHLQQFGFVVASSAAAAEKNTIIHPTSATIPNTTVTFLPYSSRRSWIEKYPSAFPHIYCGENGVVSGYPYWSEGVGIGSDDIIRSSGGVSGGGNNLSGGGGMQSYYERLFQAMNQRSLMNSSSCSTGDDGGREGAISSLSAAASVVASTTPTAAAETNSSTQHAADESILRTTSSSTRGRKKKKIFPTAHLPNEERDELHMEIYKYFEWLHNSLVAASGGATAGGNKDENEGDEDELSGRRRRQKREQSASSAGGGGGGAGGGGINISSLQQLMKCMESTFKVVGNSQISSQTDTLATTATTKMPFLEEALSEPLRKLAAISKRNSDNQQQQQQQSRWKNSRRGSTTSSSGGENIGLDFEDMFARLLQFHQEHGHVNVPQKYAPDGQLGSWVANIRSKRKLMSKRGEEFEPDIESSPIPDPAEYDDIVVGDENNDIFEDEEEEDEGNVALGDEDDGGGSGGVDRGGVDEDFNRKKRKRVSGRQRLTQERIQRLDTIGFQWVVSNSNTKSWEERFENLKEYQQYHGTTRVPRSSGTLGEWVHMQVEFKDDAPPVQQEGQELSCHSSAIDAIGFEWHPRKYSLVSWEDNFNRLVDFGRMHMHYNVQSPFPDDFLGDIEDQSAELVEAHRFAKWVKRIHAEYRSYATGKEGRMLNDARVTQLREIGFQFV